VWRALSERCCLTSPSRRVRVRVLGSGELVAEACLLGVAHPPGYPLFTLMTRMVRHRQCVCMAHLHAWSRCSSVFVVVCCCTCGSWTVSEHRSCALDFAGHVTCVGSELGLCRLCSTCSGVCVWNCDGLVEHVEGALLQVRDWRVRARWCASVWLTCGGWLVPFCCVVFCSVVILYSVLSVALFAV